MIAYLTLFWSAFGAATILPFYSEVVLLAYQHQGLDPFALWITATSGNTAGAVLNGWIGRHLRRYQDRRWFPVSAAALDKAEVRFQRWGQWSLLLAWMPIGGDALTFIGGLMRVRWSVFVTLVAIGKGARYALLMAGFSLF
ncbi:MAG: YqaA family protein [Panacagrimonas sp.]